MEHLVCFCIIDDMTLIRWITTSCIGGNVYVFVEFENPGKSVFSVDLSCLIASNFEKKNILCSFEICIYTSTITQTDDDCDSDHTLGKSNGQRQASSLCKKTAFEKFLMSSFENVTIFHLSYHNTWLYSNMIDWMAKITLDNRLNCFR